ncbi:MAG: T9SS type A sorting domain-containing protein [Bacteroidales bacterium]|nr:T9SS type A sorting domain-containing protein [Bacteroidales bacterium]
MRTKILLLLTFLTCGVISAQVEDTIRTLIITEVRLDDARRGYIEITNVGTEAIDLSEFELGKIEPWQTPLDDDYAPSANYFIMLPDSNLAPGESFMLAAVYDWGPEMWLLAPEDYDPLLTKSEMWTLADIQMHFPESPTSAASDSVSPAYHLIEFWGGREMVYLRQHRYDAGGVHFDSIMIDQVNGIWRGTDGTRWGGGNYDPIDVAGFTNASRDATLVRKFSVKKGNMDFEAGRGEDLTESEWLPIPHQAGGTWADNVRRLFWTAKAHGDYNLTEESFVPANETVTVDWTNHTITLPWGVRRDDSVMMQFVKSPGYAWHYDYAASYADSASTAAKTDDTLTVYVCGNDLDIQKFAIIVADPTNDVNIVVPKKAPNNEGFYAGVNDPVYVVSTGLEQDFIGSARFGGIPYATRVDTLIKYLEVPANANWEIVWKDGAVRSDLVDGDILRVTAANGTSVKDYYVKVDQLRKSHNAYLSTITWPDIPADYRGLYGWIGDTVPNFAITKYSYTVKVPADIDGIPALVGKTQDINAKVTVDRATNIYGSVEDATVSFKVVAQDDTTIRNYSVQLVKEKYDSLVQPYDFKPFISEFIWQDQWDNTFIEISNPGDVPMDMSKYMFSWGYVNTPAEAISRLGNNTVGDWNNRYGKYIPGYKWQDSTSWKVQAAIAIEDVNVYPIVAPGDVFVVGDIRTTAQLPSAERVYKTLFGNTVTHWWASQQCDVELATGRNPWNEPVPAWSALKQWSGANWYLFSIDNDSVTRGLKPATDPNDFTLLDVFGNGDGTDFVVSGVSPQQITTHIRKPEVWHGNTEFKGSFGTDEATSEWLRRDRPYFDARGVPWPYDILYVTQDLGGHFMEPITLYKSTISSSVYKVSQGYLLESVRGVVTGTTIPQFEANIEKADPGQTLSYKSGTDGSALAPDAVLANNDTLIVLSADAVNTTKYAIEVTDLGLSSDAVLTSATLTIAQDGKKGTISGFDYGTTLKAVYDQVTAPAGATFLVLNSDSAYVSFKTLRFDTTMTNTMVSDRILFEVIAENGTNRIVYQLQPTAANTDAFVTSDVFDIDQEGALIDLLPGGLDGFPAITVDALFANLIPAPGATMELKDKTGFPRMSGFVVKDDILVVTAADGETTKSYFLMFAGETEAAILYVSSEVYEIDQFISSIAGSEVTNLVTVSEFLANLTPSEGATAKVTDAAGTEKTGTATLTVGDKLVVTAIDGVTERPYQITVIVSADNRLQKDINVFPNPSDGSYTISGIKAGNRIQVTNIVGTLVLDKFAADDNELVNIQKERSGVYFITVSDNANVVGRYKVVKE